MRRLCLQYVTWGREPFNPNLSNKITFFHSVRRTG